MLSLLSLYYCCNSPFLYVFLGLHGVDPLRVCLFDATTVPFVRSPNAGATELWSIGYLGPCFVTSSGIRIRFVLVLHISTHRHHV